MAWIAIILLVLGAIGSFSALFNQDFKNDVGIIVNGFSKTVNSIPKVLTPNSNISADTLSYNSTGNTGSTTATVDSNYNNHTSISGWIVSVPVQAIYDMIYSGIVPVVKWLGDGITTFLVLFLNFLSHLFRVSINTTFVPYLSYTIMLGLVGWFTFKGIESLWSRLHSSGIFLLVAVVIIVVVVIFAFIMGLFK